MKRPFFIVIFAAALSVALSACSSSPRKEIKQENYLDDKVAADRVENLLRHQSAETFSHVMVTSTNGIVYLSGTVSSDAAKADADRIAGSVDGVKEVRTNIAVR